MPRTAVIAGVGPGLGESIVRRFHAEGCSVAMLARTESYIADLADEYDRALAVPTDLADPDAIETAFETIRSELGGTELLVNHASAAPWRGLTECTRTEFQRALDVGVRGAFVCSQEAVADMLGGESDAADGGTIIFTGATTSIRGREGAVGFSAAKFGAGG